MYIFVSFIENREGGGSGRVEDMEWIGEEKGQREKGENSGIREQRGVGSKNSICILYIVVLYIILGCVILIFITYLPFPRRYSTYNFRCEFAAEIQIHFNFPNFQNNLQ